MLKLNTILSLSKETESKPNQNYCSSASSEEDKKITEEYKKLICQNKSTDKKVDIVQKAIDQNTIDYLYKLKDGKYYNIIMPFLIKSELFILIENAKTNRKWWKQHSNLLQTRRTTDSLTESNINDQPGNLQWIKFWCYGQTGDAVKVHLPETNIEVWKMNFGLFHQKLKVL